MTFKEANLAYEGYRKKEYMDWLRTQRLGYIIAVSQSSKPSKIKPENIVNLSAYEDDFKEEKKMFDDEVKEILDAQPKEDIESFKARMKEKALVYANYI